MSPSYLRSRTNTQNKLPRSPQPISKNAISDRVTVVPPKVDTYRGRPLSGSRERNSWTPLDGRQSLLRDHPRGNYTSPRGQSQNGYHQSPIMSRRADETHASPSGYSGSPSQHRRSMDPSLSPAQHSPSQQRGYIDPSQSPAQHSPGQHGRNVGNSPSTMGYTGSPAQQRGNVDNRSSPAQQRRNIDPRLSPGQQDQLQYSPAQQRRKEFQYRNPGFTQNQDSLNRSSDPSPRQQPYMGIGPSNQSGHDRPVDRTSSMPRDLRNQPMQAEPSNRHPTQTPPHRSNTLPNPSRNPYVVTDLDTKQSQQISPELYDDREPPSGSSSSQTADDYFYTPETRSGESQGNPSSYAGHYSTLPGGYEGRNRDFDSQPGHERYTERPIHDSGSQSLPRQQGGGGQRSNKPYTVTDLDTRKSRDISETDLGRFVGSGNNNNSNHQPPPLPRKRSDSFGKVKVSLLFVYTTQWPVFLKAD